MPDRQQPRNYEGVTVYLPRVDMIQAGDILLSFNAESDDLRSGKVSRAITIATKGRFSHAMMCSSPPTIVEAVGTGVSTLSLARCFAHDLANVRVLRYPDQDIAARAAGLVQLEIGRDYSMRRAISSVFPAPMLARVDDHGIFCSALVARAYVMAGSTRFGQTAVERTTPATIDDLEGLEDLTLSVFRSGLAPNNIEHMSALDGNGSPSLAMQQTVISNRYGKELFPDAKSIAENYPEVGLNPTPTMYGLLDLIRNALDREEAVRYDLRPDYDRRVFELDQRLAYLIGKGEVKSLLQKIIAHDDELISRLQRESCKPSPNIDLVALRGYLEAGKVEAAQRAEAIDSWKAWGIHQSSAMGAYVWADEAALKAVRARNGVIETILGLLDGKPTAGA